MNAIESIAAMNQERGQGAATGQNSTGQNEPGGRRFHETSHPLVHDGTILREVCPALRGPAFRVPSPSGSHTTESKEPSQRVIEVAGQTFPVPESSGQQYLQYPEVTATQFGPLPPIPTLPAIELPLRSDYNLELPPGAVALVGGRRRTLVPAAVAAALDPEPEASQDSGSHYSLGNGSSRVDSDSGLVQNLLPAQQYPSMMRGPPPSQPLPPLPVRPLRTSRGPQRGSVRSRLNIRGASERNHQGGESLPWSWTSRRSSQRSWCPRALPTIACERPGAAHGKRGTGGRLRERDADFNSRLHTKQ
ncbi:hypothetical protein QBC33DRAFT_537975 [Phialemonium atrogriseum]|uniref:Uncharacterized protein n=1 Tax=Phialemonium atrogriseum TaxID=1093897 RepID=A0AAJ0BZG5_9PEZI|nr:uncharacterized protein QBC33DRAFT_537975 [Phialemonium atrogriseum]KAK1767319.1 hypothetical protein QBC33DRAFT_537975 [Phialemonium atrogriseum]